MSADGGRSGTTGVNSQSLSWTVHRARETPLKTLLAVLFVLSFLGFVVVFFEPVLALVGAIVLLLALNSYFLPVTFTFHQRGLTVDKRLFKAEYQWSQFRRWLRTSGGIVLSPFSQPSWLDNFRGVHLLLPEDDSAIVDWLQRQFAPPADDRLRLDDNPVVEQQRELRSANREEHKSGV